jgi:hypothetical protein
VPRINADERLFARIMYPKRDAYLLDLIDPSIQERARENLDILIRYREFLESEIFKLSGELNPIRRCPSDILQIIFEWAVHFSDVGPYQDAFDLARQTSATAISHVCRRWRSVALRTPLLWCYIDVPMGRSIQSTLWYWERATGRIRGYPSYIRIAWSKTPRLVNEVRDVITIAKLCPLKVCRLLILELYNENDILDILTPTFSLSIGQLDKVIINYRFNSTGLSIWSLRDLLQKFPAVPSVELYPFQTNCTGTAQFPTLQHLYFRYMPQPSILDICHAFPALETLCILRIKYPIQARRRIVLPKMTHLILGPFDDGWMTNLSCPKLQTLDHRGTLSESLLAFIERHTTLMTLKFYKIKEGLTALAIVAPQITSLSFGRGVSTPLWDWKKVGLDQAPFTVLKHLILEDQNASISLSLFESLLSTRCLPHQYHSDKSSCPPPLETLQVGFSQVSFRTCPWWLKDYCSLRLKTETTHGKCHGRYVVIKHNNFAIPCPLRAELITSVA